VLTPQQLLKSCHIFHEIQEEQKRKKEQYIYIYMHIKNSDPFCIQLSLSSIGFYFNPFALFYASITFLEHTVSEANMVALLLFRSK
jgi:hypothetical protein